MPQGNANMVGHNSGELTPIEARALYMYHFNLIAAQRSVVEIERKKERTLRKEAKAKGVILSDVDWGLRCANTDDPNIIAQQVARENEIARWFNIPVGQQADFDFEAEPGEDRAAREGASAGFSGGPREHPSHASDSKFGQAYIKAYDRAAAERAAALASALAKLNNPAAPGDDEAEIKRPEFAN